MKTHIAKPLAAWAGAAALGLSLAPQAALASEQVMIGGKAQIESPFVIEFQQSMPGLPFALPPGYGTFDVNSVQVMGSPPAFTLPTSSGMIQSFGAAPGPVSLFLPFITFDGAPAVQLWLTRVFAPPSNGFGIFQGTGTGGGASLQFAAQGYVLDNNTKVEGFNFVGTIQTPGVSPADVRGVLPLAGAFTGEIDTIGLDQLVDSGAPEPAGWALMIAGFGGLGVALRRDRRRRLAA